MARRHLSLYLKIFAHHFIGNVRASFFVILILSQFFLENGRYCVTAISHRSSSSTTKAEKFGAYMERQPESTVAPLYDEVLFECGLNLDSDRIEWRFRPQKQRFNSVNNHSEFIYLNRMDGYNITTEDSISKLRIYVNQYSAGEYQCLAWLGASALASIPAKLLLANISVDTSVNARVLHWRVPPGNSILINCGEVKSNPQPIWNFYKDDQPLSNTNPQLSTGALMLQSVTHLDSGTYWCKAVNTITGVEVKSLQKTSVTVEHTPRGPPTLLYSSSDHVIVKPGATAILECPGIGYPVPKTSWTRPGTVISNNRTSVFGTGLQILNARPEDRGEYICQLDNGIIPAKTLKIRLDVLEAPKIERGPIDTLTDEGERLELECIATGFPIPTIYWLINGVDTRMDPTIRATGSRLIIDGLQKKHAGIVQCFARNEESEVCESKLLQVKPKTISGDMMGTQPLGTIPNFSKSNRERNSKPGKGKKKHKHTIMVPPTRPNVTRLADDKVMVRWSVPPHDEGLPILFFKVQYRLLGSTTKPTKRSQWMTADVDIAPNTFMYEVDGLKASNWYRFRIAAVYSNNDNQLSNASRNFLLRSIEQIDERNRQLPAPNLTRVEPISETSVVLHWTLAEHNQIDFDGFYAYFRPASTAGEYMKATIDGMEKRSFQIDDLESGTAYEFKLQSFTSSAASDFMAIITGKTLKPSTPSPIDPSVITTSKSTTKPPKPYVLLVAGLVGAGFILLITFIFLCFFMKRRKKSGLHDANENKSHPDHIQAEANGFPVGNVGSNGRINSPVHKNRLNGVVPRMNMNITPNPLADGDKVFRPYENIPVARSYYFNRTSNY
ncbi:interference hedgehog isoform X2 [Sitodiplosis mosellana]|uniref:interference hedgehog isoform X2 n=1 Tax=Sitodiplosis mosellana TaxID=263140 RepID=UPI002445272F|nr:interference hedgehog isoform X2 [Sitodiplosis mosellana]